MKGETKRKISITLSRDVLKAIDRAAGTKYSRSTFIETALRHYFRELRQAKLLERERATIHAHDLEILNRYADRLNAEAEETLQYQVDPWRPAE